MNLCSSGKMDKTCGLGVIKYASVNMAVELLNTTRAVTPVQKERKWLQAYSLCRKIRWPPVTTPHGLYKDTLLRQCARIIDRIFFNGAVLKHLLTFDRNTQTGGIMYWDPCFWEADPESLGVWNGVASTSMGRHNRKGLHPDSKNPPPTTVRRGWVKSLFYLNQMKKHIRPGVTTNDGFKIKDLHTWILHAVCHEMCHAIFQCTLKDIKGEPHNWPWLELTGHIYGATDHKWYP